MSRMKFSKSVGRALAIAGAAAAVSSGAVLGLAGPASAATPSTCVVQNPLTGGAETLGTRVSMNVGIQIVPPSGSSTCVINQGDAFTAVLPSGWVAPGVPGGGAQIVDNGLFTCTIPGAGSTATCVADNTPGGAVGQINAAGVSGYFPAIPPSGVTPGNYPVAVSGDFGTGSANLIISSCPAGTPLLDPEVAGTALAAAGVLGGALLVVRRRRTAGSQA